MPREADFLSHLSADERKQFEAFARVPKNKIRQCVEWVTVKGIVTSRTAVGRWFKQFKETDRMSEAAEMADAILTANTTSGTVDVVAGVNLQLAQRLQFALVKGGNNLAIGDLLKASMAISAVTNAQGKLNELKKVGKAALDQLKGNAARRPVTPEEIEEISKRVFG